MKTMMISFLLSLALLSQNPFALAADKATDRANNGLKFGDPLPANAFIELAKLINPAVVNISTSTMPKRNQYRDPFFDMLEQFYGFRMAPQQMRPQQALGSGFIIREDGLIVTNNHVISGADVINVQLVDHKKSYEAKVVGSDDRTDIALIKIQSDKKFPFTQLGTSKDVEVGEWVAAFGNPFGQSHTMTKGIISAKGRDLNEINRFPMIQTDTPINPGNSGGPLVNLKGQVIGVNAAIDPRAQGIGFAIPIDEVKSILPQLETVGRIRKGYLGVGLGEMDPMAAAQLGIKDASGALIAGVEKNGPAAKGGVQPYDVVTEFNGKEIKSPTELTNAVADAEIGSTASLKVIREGKIKTLSLKIVERPDQFAHKSFENGKKTSGQKAPHELGFQVADFNENLRREFDINPELTEGAVVIEVTGGPAAMVGMAPGDVIIDVNRKPIKNSKGLMKEIKKGTNTLRLVRNDMVRIVVLQSPE